VQATWTFSPAVLCLPEYSSGWSFQDQHSSRVPSMISWAVGSRSSRGLEGLGDQGCVGADDAGDGGLGDAVELGEQLLGQVVPQVGQGQAHAQEQPQHPYPENRQIGVLGENGLAQADNLTPRDSRASIRHGGLLLGWIGLSAKDSLKSKPPPCLAICYCQQNTLNTPMNKPQGVEMELPFDSWIFESKGSP